MNITRINVVSVSDILFDDVISCSFEDHEYQHKASAI